MNTVNYGIQTDIQKSAFYTLMMNYQKEKLRKQSNLQSHTHKKIMTKISRNKPN